MRDNSANIPAMEEAVRFVETRTGLSFSSSRRSEARVAVHRFMTKAGITDGSRYVVTLEHEPVVLDGLIAELTVGETYFFREPRQFDLILSEVIPHLTALRGANHLFRIWSAGCASGEEAYSLAILFDEANLGDRVRILATDISRAALSRAQKATYSAWSLRGESKRLIDRYLHKEGSRFKLEDHIRHRVKFRHLNLAKDSYRSVGATDLDLILCRNVLIYLEGEAVGAIARRFHRSLATGGYLFTGPSDPLLSDFAPFHTLVTEAGIIYRKGKPSAKPPARLTTAISVPTFTPAQPAAVSAEKRPVAKQVAPPSKPKEPTAISEAEKIRELANSGNTEAAATQAAEAMKANPSSQELMFLRAMLLMDIRQISEAEKLLRKLLYSNRSLAVGHYAFGTALLGMGNLKEAQRAYRNAAREARKLPADEVLALSDGEKAGKFAEAAEAQAKALETRMERKH